MLCLSSLLQREQAHVAQLPVSTSPPSLHCDILMWLWLLLLSPSSHLRRWVPLFHIPRWHAVPVFLLMTAVFSSLATGNAWNMTGSEYCIPLLLATLWCFSTSSHFRRQVPFSTCLQWCVCAVSVILNCWTLVFSCLNYWERNIIASE